MSRLRATASSSVQPPSRVAYAKTLQDDWGVSLSVKKSCQFPAKSLQGVTFPQRLEGFPSRRPMLLASTNSDGLPFHCITDTTSPGSRIAGTGPLFGPSHV